MDRTSAHKPSVSKELSKGKPFVICEIQVNLNLKKKNQVNLKSTSYIEATNKHIQDVIVNHDIIRSLTEENTRKSSAICIDKLIDWIEFYAVSAIFQPCNGGSAVCN